MFFIGGIQPKKIRLDEQPRICDSCGLFQARLYRMDHYLSIFFIPLIRLKKGPTFIECDRCGAVLPEKGGESVEIQKAGPISYCGNCGRSIEAGFRFCPFCGKRV
ncbi:MAG: zinc ribbon domain-containing protein [Deltaproteobacteria bacterium]|nr:zinc ribbon domain-containing protein [Deltaproteobacteria bacterium]